MFEALGILYVDHFAVTTSNLERTMVDFLKLPGAKLLRGPAYNSSQDVKYAFVSISGSGCIEILAPGSDTSPVVGHIKGGGGAYHLCYAVHDLDAAITEAESNYGAKVVVKPRADDAFDNRRVAFLFHEDHGLFELLDAWPKEKDIVETCLSTKEIINPIQDEVEKSLLDVFIKILDQSFSSVESVNKSSQWDSLKHLMLVMEIEKVYGISIPAQEIANLRTFEKLVEFIKSKI